jgi:4-hydroxy-3-methylbut-2-enyl diphosphate reductase
MLVIGGHNSANTRHLVKLCATAAKTYPVETADEIQPAWFQNKHHIGITAGASTDEQTIKEVLNQLESIP